MTGKLKLKCPGCGKGLMAPDTVRGKTIRCADCSTKFRVGGVDSAGKSNKPAAAAPAKRAVAKAPKKKSAAQPARKSRSTSRPAGSSSRPARSSRPQPAKKRRRKVEDELFDDDWDDDSGDWGDDDEWDAPAPRRASKPRLPPRSRKKKKASTATYGDGRRTHSDSGGRTATGEFLIGLAMLLLGPVVFVAAWIGGYIWPYPWILSAIGLFKIFAALGSHDG